MKNTATKTAAPPPAPVAADPDTHKHMNGNAPTELMAV